MKGSRITPLQALEGTRLPDKPSLVLIEPARIPPHLALIHKGLYYSLSVKGVELERDATRILQTLDRKGKGFLLLPFEMASKGADASSVFSSYEGSEPPSSSCLAPLRDFCGISKSISIGTVHDLLHELEKEGRFRPPFLIRNMKAPESGEFRIPDYGEEDVREHLRRYEQGRSVR